jgi:hypothetical protein
MIFYPKDGWILEKIGRELSGIKIQANYYINWCYWKILDRKLTKSKFDAVLFTHFDEYSNLYLDVLDKADLIICMSGHGKLELIGRGIPASKIKVCPYWGVSISKKKKVVIGTSGKNQDRKNRKELERLKKDLNSSIFDFRQSENTDNKFFTHIDYYLQTSIAEGGSMDILNAIYSRVPVVSRDIGFIYNFKTSLDFIYTNYGQLLGYFKSIEESIKEKDRFADTFRWDNFRNWHIELLNKGKD